jgi:hypothetical protein
MSHSPLTDDQLLAYLDEMLPVDQMAAVEKQLRSSDSLRLRTANLASRRDHGLHSVGEIWRHDRLSCPTRSQLGSFLLGTLDEQHTEYVEFHIRTVGCRYCAANLNDLEQAMESGAAETVQRRRKFFQSSAGYLKSRG